MIRANFYDAQMVHALLKETTLETKLWQNCYETI